MIGADDLIPLVLLVVVVAAMGSLGLAIAAQTDAWAVAFRLLGL